MSLAIDLFGSAVVFAGAIIALGGTTWNPDARCINKLTKTGWSALLIVVLGFSLNVYQTIQKDNKREALHQKINQDLKQAWSNLTVPFALIKWEVTGEKQEINLDLLKSFRNKEFLSKVDGIDFNKTPPIPLYETWGKVFCDTTTIGFGFLERTANNYYGEMERALYTAIYSVKNSHLPKRIFRLVPPCGKLTPKTGFKGFINNPALPEYLDALELMGNEIGVL